MTILFWIGTCLAIIYGCATFASGVYQWKVRNIPLWSARVLTIVGACVVIVSLLLLINQAVFIALIVCLFILHIMAIVNGMHLYGKINISHHVIRFSISMVIIISLII